ncbi:5-methylcytosine restriction system specificity protein McrC [Albibacterium indicum]|uniref:5-methylcytosine restriction system specificity protein McrC n=1 Tax=Albibacterium indicum TaxID=2292082 RepID=UPI000E4E4799|nr:restriction endonuclease [Pedobacter indicus]
MGLLLTEHKVLTYSKIPQGDALEHTIPLTLLRSFQSKKLFKNQTSCIVLTETETEYSLQADYLIGVDWLIPQKRFIQVVPKLNREVSIVFDEVTNVEADPELEQEDKQFQQRVEGADLFKQEEVDYLRMLMIVAGDVYFDSYLGDLFYLDYDAHPIELQSQQDMLTPLLVVRYLKLVRRIVQKGLKKSYYKEQENLNNKVRGRILVGQHIKQNVFKNRPTRAYCEYQVFGVDTYENRFLKKVSKFVALYVDTHSKLFHSSIDEIKNTLNYISPAFEPVNTEVSSDDLRYAKHNPFYNEYKEAIKIGKLILHRFSYNITTAQNIHTVFTSPFWINMPGLFEMYLCAQLRLANIDYQKFIKFQFRTYGNSLDILVTHKEFAMVIDAKYKLKYQRGQVHQDIRQVSGYARLKKVRRELKIDDNSNEVIECLIIYPDLDNGITDFSLANIKARRQAIPAYHKIYKIGVKVPIIAS